MLDTPPAEITLRLNQRSPAPADRSGQPDLDALRRPAPRVPAARLGSGRHRGMPRRRGGRGGAGDGLAGRSGPGGLARIAAETPHGAIVTAEGHDRERAGRDPGGGALRRSPLHGRDGQGPGPPVRRALGSRPDADEHPRRAHGGEGSRRAGPLPGGEDGHRRATGGAESIDRDADPAPGAGTPRSIRCSTTS